MKHVEITCDICERECEQSTLLIGYENRARFTLNMLDAESKENWLQKDLCRECYIKLIDYINNM